MEKYMVKLLCATPEYDCSYVGAESLFDRCRMLSLRTYFRREGKLYFCFARNMSSDWHLCSGSLIVGKILVTSNFLNRECEPNIGKSKVAVRSFNLSSLASALVSAGHFTKGVKLMFHLKSIAYLCFYQSKDLCSSQHWNIPQ